MTTISVVCAIWGLEYRQFVNRWWDSVVSLERTPDQIVIVTDKASFFFIQTSRPAGYDVALKIVVMDDELKFHEYWDRAYRECDMDWIANLAIDDVFLPEALNDIDRADAEGCELVSDGCRFTDQPRIWKGYWNPVEMFDSMTMPGGAPMRKDMFERLGGFPWEIYWLDWAFYMVCAKAGVKVYQTDTMRITHNLGADHKTRSGVLLDSETRQKADQQIFAYAAELRARP
jgi:hypothetical protein